MIRLQDIADMAGVSRTTVSNVLHGKTKKVSSKNIQKITELLKESGYVPNMGSLILTNQKSKLIGLVIGYEKTHGNLAMADPFVSEMTGVLHELVERYGYYLMLIGGENLDNVVNIASRWNVDGLILFASSERVYMELRKKLNKPVVGIDIFRHKASDLVNVGIDDYHGGYMAGQHLLERGFQELLFLAEYNENADAQRWLGMQQAARDGGLVCDERNKVLLSHYLNVRLKTYQDMMPRFLKAGGLFCAADYLAVEVINYCTDQGIGVPGQISVIGFDDNMLANLVRPRLTTIRQPIREKVNRAFHNLLKVMNNEEVPEIDVRLPVELVVRDSVI